MLGFLAVLGIWLWFVLSMMKLPNEEEEDCKKKMKTDDDITMLKNKG